MFDLEVCLGFLTLGSLTVGGWGIWWDAVSRSRGRLSWGRNVCLITLLALGISSLVAAFYRAEGLVPLGLTAGALVIGMLWESPVASAFCTDGLSLSEEA